MSTAYLEQLYQQYLTNPGAVDPSWQAYFKQNGPVKAASQGTGAVATPKADDRASDMLQSTAAGAAATAQGRVSRLMQAYRAHGHRSASTNPLRAEADVSPELALSHFGLGDENLDTLYATNGLLNEEYAPLRDILEALQATYTGSIGAQFVELAEAERLWLQQRMETVRNAPTYSAEEKQRIYHGLMVANNFEKFLHTKFVGVKRFSIEGADSLIPMLDMLTETAADQGVHDIVMGMAHRGRLNVLANIMHKPMVEMMAGFNDTMKFDNDASSGDVKYHMGKSYDVTTSNGHKIHFSLLNNPSHLEAVNPVVLGSTKAKQVRVGDVDGSKVLPLLIHGDSAFAGQGVVMETLNMAGLQGFNVGGTIHVVINNQLGYTAEPQEAFSGEYCTDVARLAQVPIFHVNGDDPEACVHVMQLAMAYRKQFKRDVVIDLVCYRRHGHNEGDDPSFTQPTMYQTIKQQAVPAAGYKQRLEQEQAMSADQAKQMESDYHERMSEALEQSKTEVRVARDMFGSVWQGFSESDDKASKTAVTKKALQAVAESTVSWPTDFTINPKVGKVIELRAKMQNGKEKLNWGAAEMAAYGTLLQEGYSVRLTGQDVQRGTFSHRHAALVDYKTGVRIYPSTQLAKDNARFEVYNSCLSEYGVMGFEFGYSLADPNTLTIWEAQFGDFANGAQIMIDQFISGTEIKWQRLSGLVLLLPHGQEGQGPEHSSARLERFLQLCGDDNMIVANPTTPAQMFHLLRRQIHRKVRKPLVVMTPKSLLRHPEAVSPQSELTKGGFNTVIADEAVKPKKARKVVLTSGKLYYELAKYRADKNINDVAVVRVEQYYPLPTEALKTVLKSYSKNVDLVWAQEEPRNQGAWQFLRDTLFEELGRDVSYVGRPASASPAAGNATTFIEGQGKLVVEAFA